MTTIRAATHTDLTALDRLAQLDSSQIPAGDLLVAENDDAIVAAISTKDGAVIANPFVRTADTVSLLRRRASQPPRRVLAPGGWSRDSLELPPAVRWVSGGYG